MNKIGKTHYSINDAASSTFQCFMGRYSLEALPWIYIRSLCFEWSKSARYSHKYADSHKTLFSFVLLSPVIFSLSSFPLFPFSLFIMRSTSTKKAISQASPVWPSYSEVTSLLMIIVVDFNQLGWRVESCTYLTSVTTFSCTWIWMILSLLLAPSYFICFSLNHLWTASYTVKHAAEILSCWPWN